jgi:hypothetical protein
VAYHFHWHQDAIVDLPHSDRLRWVKEISAINRHMNERSNENEFDS